MHMKQRPQVLFPQPSSAGQGSACGFAAERSGSSMIRQRSLPLVGLSLDVRSDLEVVIGGQVLEEVALLHDAVELVDVDLAIAITVGLVDHVLELLIIDVLAQLL